MAGVGGECIAVSYDDLVSGCCSDASDHGLTLGKVNVTWLWGPFCSVLVSYMTQWDPTRVSIVIADNTDFTEF